MFEPVHGSAPDIAGKGMANPISTLWTVEMVLDLFGENMAAEALMATIEKVTISATLTPDLGGTTTAISFFQ